MTHLVWIDWTAINASGQFKPPTESQMAEMRQLRDLTHQKGKKLLYCVASVFSDARDNMLAHATRRAAFIQDLTAFVRSNELDGTDFDFEYPDNASDQSYFSTFLHEMRAALGRDLLLTADTAYWAVQIPVSTVNSDMDWVQIMDYYYQDTANSETNVQRYTNAGIYPSKVVLGVAFAGKSSSVGYDQKYNVLINYMQPYSPDVDVVTNSANGYIYYLCGNRTTQKAKMWVAASKANGTMIWHLSCDTTDPNTSLAVALTEARTNRVAVVDGYEQVSGVDLGKLYTSGNCELSATHERACGDTALQATFSFDGTKWNGGNFASRNFPTAFAFPSAGQLRIDFDILDAQPNVTLYLRLFDSAGLKADYYNTIICETTGWKRLLLPRSSFTADAGFDFANIRNYQWIAQLSAAGSATTMRAIFDNFVMLDPTPSDRPVAVDATLFWNENGSANQWNTTSAHWLADNRSLAYYEGGKVWFDDSASQHTVTLPANTNPGSVDVSASANYVFTGAGAMTGGTSLHKQNSGTLTIQNGNSFSGTVTISGGKLKLDGTTGGSFYRMADFFGIQNQTYVTVKNGATFSTWNWDYGSANALGYLRHNYGQIVVDGGILEFDDTFSSRRAFSVGANGGTLSVTPGHTYTKAVGNGADENLIRFTANSTLTLGGAGDGVIEDSLGAYGNTGFSISKTGTGTWTLKGANTYSGGTTVSEGTLAISNISGSATGTGMTSVASTATLRGAGAMAGSVINSGTLAPEGQIDIGGNLTLQPTSHLDIRISGNGADTLNVGQTATYGGLLNIRFVQGFTPAVGASYTILSAAGAKTGSFSNIASGSRLMVGSAGSFRVTYDGSNLVAGDFRDDTDLDGMPDAYEIEHGFDRGDSADGSKDADGDGMSNHHEYLAGCDPRDPTSVLRAEIAPSADGGFTFRFSSVSGKTYIIEWMSDPADATGTPLVTVPGTGGYIEIQDAGAADSRQRIYRIRLGP